MLQNTKLILHGMVGVCIGCANFFGDINLPIWFIWAILILIGIRSRPKENGILSWGIFIMMEIVLILAIFYLKIGVLLFTIFLLMEDILIVWENKEQKKTEANQTVDFNFQSISKEIVVAQNIKFILHGVVGICITCAHLFNIMNLDAFFMLMIIWVMFAFWADQDRSQNLRWNRYFDISAWILLPLVIFNAEIYLSIIVAVFFVEGILMVWKGGQMRTDQNRK